jgi:uncharacterized protein YndB with AHSA1/START domain
MIASKEQAMDGKLQIIEGRSVLRFERRLAHPPEKVWRAITEPSHLGQWFPAAVQMELRLGAEICFDFGDGSGAQPDGVITELDPPRAFGFSWGADRLHFALHPERAGCRLVFTHTFDDHAGAASFASGWQLCLDGLGMLLDGKPIGLAEDTGELHEAYVAALGLGKGTVEAAPEGWRVRFERQLTRPADALWALLTASPHRPAPEVGGPPPRAFTAEQFPAGPVTTVEAPALLEYEWLFEGRPAGRVRWELGRGTGHGARLLLTQTGPARLAGRQAVALAAWRGQIERLAGSLLGEARATPAGSLGTFSATDDGRFALRFERQLAHPPAKVWRAITEWEHLRAWFPAVVSFDLRPGARLRFEPTAEQKARFNLSDADAPPSDGRVTLVDPPHLLEYTWEAEVLRWELRPEGDGGCRLVFTHTFDDREMAAALGAGWHAGLEVVAAQLDGREAGLPAWERVEQLNADYVRMLSSRSSA